MKNRTTKEVGAIFKLRESGGGGKGIRMESILPQGRRGTETTIYIHTHGNKGKK